MLRKLLRPFAPTLAAAALAAPLHAAAQAAPEVPLPLRVVDVRDRAVVMLPDPQRIAGVEHLGAMRTEPLLLPDGTLAALDLVRIDLARLRLGVHADGEARPTALGELALSLWRGTVAGEPSSSVYLALSRRGCRGWIARGGELFHVLALPGAVGGWNASQVVVVGELALPAAGRLSRAPCEGPLVAPGARPPRPPAPEGSSGVVLECPVAVEGDYQLFQQFGDAGAELAYVVALLGAVSARYEEQLEVVLTFPYLNLWSTSSDPWTTPDTGGTTLAMLNEFRSAWAGAIPAGASLAHFLSGASLGGGIAYLDVLCDGSWGFGVSANLTQFGLTPFPVVQGPFNWDFVVIAHELGHNFSAIHTHEECPPLDECAPSGYFGSCQSAQVCTDQGTLMSYCHLCAGGLADVTTYFHAAQVPGMRSAAESSCLTVYCADEVYADAGYVGQELGTQAQPFDTLVEALAETCDAGTVWLAAGVYDEPTPLTISQAVTLKTTGGAVELR